VWENSGFRFSYSLTADGYLNRWLHFAISRNNGTTSIFKNGIQIGSSYIDTNNINNTSTALSIGQESTPTANSYFPGYISNFRIVKGTAVYTSSFTPSTTPLTAVANTSLLTCNAATIVDSSTNNFTITNNNGATVSSTSPFVASSGGMSLKKVFADPVASIVTSGLVLNLDAGNIRSYAGSGTSWYNLNGNNTGSLTNGPTYTSSFGGGIVFDGINDYVNIPYSSSLSPATQFTLGAFVNITGWGSNFASIIYKQNNFTTSYPNPTKDIITVSGIMNEPFSLTNLTGEKILSGILNLLALLISISDILFLDFSRLSLIRFVPNKAEGTRSITFFFDSSVIIFTAWEILG
jgi:hypothetical protein